MREAIIIGAGGQCRVVLSLLSEASAYSMIRIVDLNASSHQLLETGEYILGYAVYTPLILKKVVDDTNIDIFLAIGDCNLRSQWREKLSTSLFNFPNLVSQSAVIDPGATLGSGNIICARAFIGPAAEVGDNNLVNTGAILEHESRLGSNCHLAPGSIIAGRSQVGDNCFIGAGAILIDNLAVAKQTIVGAGAVVISNIHRSSQVYVGVPAKVVDRSKQ